MHTLRSGLPIAVLVALLLTACSGSDDASPPPAAPQDTRTAEQREDDAASANIGGLVSFLLAQIAAATSDSTEPRNIGGINAPSSETDEPVAL